MVLVQHGSGKGDVSEESAMDAEGDGPGKEVSRHERSLSELGILCLKTEVSPDFRKLARIAKYQSIQKTNRHLKRSET